MKFAQQLLIALPVALGAAVLTTAAQAAVPPEGSSASHGCVSNRTGVLRVIDPAKGQGCITTNDRFNETAIEWTQSDGSAPVGVAAAGTGGTAIEYLDQLDGTPCDLSGAAPGVVKIAYSGSGAIAMTCEKTGAPAIANTDTTAPAAATTTTTSTTTSTTATTEPPG